MVEAHYSDFNQTLGGQMSNNELIVFKGDDAAYLRWLDRHPEGFVLNIEHTLNLNNTVLHRASCPTIGRANKNVSMGGFTQRSYIKICDNSVVALRRWVQSRGRLDGTFSKICSICEPDIAEEEESVSAVLQLLGEVFTAETIMTARDQIFSWPLGQDISAMKKQRDIERFDLVPASYEGEIVGLYFEEKEEPQSLTREWLVSKGTPISELLGLFANSKKPGYLVIHGQSVVGIVTPADLNKLPARIYIYNLIGELELGLANLIRHQIDNQQDMLSPLSYDRQTNLQEEIDELISGNVDVDPVQLFYLSDLVNVVVNTDQLRMKLGFSSRKEAEKTLNGLVHMRNSIMHLVRPLLKRIPEDLIKQYVRVQRIEMILRRLD